MHRQLRASPHRRPALRSPALRAQRRLREAEARTRRQLERAAGLYEALSRSHRAIVRGADRATLCSEVCAACVDAGHALLASVWFVEGDRLALRAVAGPVEELFGRANPSWGLDEPAFAGSLTAAVLRDGQPRFSNDYLGDPRTRPWHDIARHHHVRALASAPLHHGGQVVGVLILHIDEPDWFDADLLRLLQELAADLGFALDNIDRERARAAAEREARRSNERFRRIFHAAPVRCAIVAHPGGQLLDANEALLQGLGLAGVAWRGRTPAELGVGMAPADAERLRTALAEDGGRLRSFEVRSRRLDGQWRDLLLNCELIDFGERAAILTISIDITERKAVERSLRERELQLAGIVETAMDAIITVDATQCIRVFNQSAARMFRIDADEAIGQPLERFIPRPVRAAHAAHLRDFRVTGSTSRRMGALHTLSGLRADGEEFPIEASISRLGDGEGALMTAVVRDLTAALDAERAREAQIAAEAASRAKSQFISRMSHELRTPLNAVLGFTQLLDDDPREALSPRQREYVAHSRQAGWHLLGLIDDLLDVSRIEAGELHVALAEVHAAGVVEAACLLVAPQARERAVHLCPPLAADCSLYLRADAARLRQVLINLLSNAVKYNRPGGEVRVSLHASGDEVLIDVVDDGIGMTTEQREHLFEPFNRLGRERSGVEGTGIGLALTRQLVLAMHGRIEVESAPGRGTRMRVALPAAEAPMQRTLPLGAGPLPAGLPLPAGPAGTVLYVEDDPVNMLLVEQFLARWPAVRLLQAASGSEALALARAQRPDLVLLDMHLPDMGGPEILRQLRAHDSTRGLPVIVLSAAGQPQDMAAARTAGAADYWTKPLDFRRFERELRPWLEPA